MLSADVIVNDVPLTLAVTPTAFIVVTVPKLCTVTKIRVLAVMVVFETVTVPPDSVAVPILELAPPLITRPFPAELTVIFPVDTSTPDELKVAVMFEPALYPNITPPLESFP